MTLDVISEYCFGEPMGGLTSPVYGKVWLDAIHEGIRFRPLGRHFPWLVHTLMDLPPSITAKLNGAMGIINIWLENMQDKIELIMKHEDKSSKEGSRRRTVFHDMRDDTSGKLPPAEKDPKQLGKHALIFIGAGTETTARTLAVTTYYLMKYPEIGDKLRRELVNAIPKNGAEEIPSPQLEALPYLNAVISEGLRCAHGVSVRLPRIARHEDLTYNSYTIPRGQAVMQSPYLLHTDPAIFPEPLQFRPERWLENPSLKRNVLPFGRGSRACLGMNLATSGLHYGIAMLWRRFRMEIYDTVEEKDVLTQHDVFIGLPDLKSKGVQARVLGEMDERANGLNDMVKVSC